MSSVKIFPRSSVPTELQYLLQEFDDQEEDIVIEAVSYIVHVPKSFMEDESVRRMYDISLFSNTNALAKKLYQPIHSLVGTNAVDIVNHPEEDGIVIVLSCV